MTPLSDRSVHVHHVRHDAVPDLLGTLRQAGAEASDGRLYHRIAYGPSAWHLLVLFTSAWTGGLIESAAARIAPAAAGHLASREPAPRDLESRCPGTDRVHVATFYDPFLNRLSPRVRGVYVEWSLDSCENLARIMARTRPDDRLVFPATFLCRFMRDRLTVSARAHDSFLSHVAGYLTMTGPRRDEMRRVLAAREDRFARATTGAGEAAAGDGVPDVSGELLSLHRDLMGRLGGIAVGEFTEIDGPQASRDTWSDTWSDTARIHRTTVLDDEWLSEHRTSAAWVQNRFEINVAYQLLSQVGVGYTDRIGAAYIAFNLIERRLGGNPDPYWEQQWKPW